MQRVLRKEKTGDVDADISLSVLACLIRACYRLIKMMARDCFNELSQFGKPGWLPSCLASSENGLCVYIRRWAGQLAEISTPATGISAIRPARLRIKHKDNLKNKQGMGRASQVHRPARLTGRPHFIPKPQYLQINSQD